MLNVFGIGAVNKKMQRNPNPFPGATIFDGHENPEKRKERLEHFRVCRHCPDSEGCTRLRDCDIHR